MTRKRPPLATAAVSVMLVTMGMVALDTYLFRGGHYGWGVLGILGIVGACAVSMRPTPGHSSKEGN